MGWDEGDGERVFMFVCSKVRFVCLSVCMRIFMCLSENAWLGGEGTRGVMECIHIDAIVHTKVKV